MSLLPDHTLDYRVQLRPNLVFVLHHHLQPERHWVGLRQNCLAPYLQLPIKSAVSIDATILSGLSENNIVLSDTLLNSSVEVVAFTSDTEPDCAPWINKNVLQSYCCCQRAPLSDSCAYTDSLLSAMIIISVVTAMVPITRPINTVVFIVISSCREYL